MIQSCSKIATEEVTSLSEEAQGEKIVEALEQTVPIKKTIKFPPMQEDFIIQKIKTFSNFLIDSDLSPITFRIDPELKSQEIEDQDEYGKINKNLIYFKEITIDLDPFKDLEWEIAGTKNPITSNETGTGIKGNVIFLKNKLYKGPEVPKEIQTRDMICEHCNTNHARSKTIILYNKETGVFKEVGRSCLKFYLGNLNPEFPKKFSSFLENIVFKDHGESKKVSAIDLIDLIAATYYVVKKEGRYISQSYLIRNPNSNLQPTISMVNYYMFSNPIDIKNNKDKEELIEGQKEIEDLKPKAEEIIKWWRNNEATMRHNNFLDKMRSILRFNSINPKLTSFASYLVEIWREATEEKGKEIKNKPSEFQGTIGDEIERTLYIKRANSFNGLYGIVFIYSMEDDFGNEYTWFTSKTVLEDKKKYKVKAVVKDHKNWFDRNGNEHKQTVLTRVKII